MNFSSFLEESAYQFQKSFLESVADRSREIDAQSLPSLFKENDIKRYGKRRKKMDAGGAAGEAILDVLTHHWQKKFMELKTFAYVAAPVLNDAERRESNDYVKSLLRPNIKGSITETDILFSKFISKNNMKRVGEFDNALLVGDENQKHVGFFDITIRQEKKIRKLKEQNAKDLLHFFREGSRARITSLAIFVCYEFDFSLENRTLHFPAKRFLSEIRKKLDALLLK